MAKAKKKTYEKKKKKDNADPMFKAALNPPKGADRFGRMGAVIDAAQATHGPGFIGLATRTEALIVPRVSSNIMSFDILSNGGYPLRRIMMVFGEESSGKTNMLLRGVSNAQKICGNCMREAEFDYGEMTLPDLKKPGKTKKVETQVIVDCSCGNPRDFMTLWIDSEGVWYPEWVEQLGVWNEKLLMLRPQYAEQSYDFVCAMVASGTIDLICIDSIAQMAPRSEVEASMHTDQVGIGARVNNRFWRKLVSGMNRCYQDGGNIPGVWAINQYRKKIGVMFGPNDELPGGMGQKFISSLSVECRKGKVIMSEKDEPIEGEFSFTIKKNKLGTEGGKGVYAMAKMESEFTEVGEVLEHEAVIMMALDIGIVQKPSAVTYVFDGTNFRGKGQLEIHLIEHPEVYLDLKNKVLAAKLGFDETT